MEILRSTHARTCTVEYTQCPHNQKKHTQKLTCRCFPCINVPLLHSESSWEIKRLLVDAFFPLLLLLMCFLFIRMSFPISLSVQVCWLSLTPCRWVSQNNHFHVGERRNGAAAPLRLSRRQARKRNKSISAVSIIASPQRAAAGTFLKLNVTSSNFKRRKRSPNLSSL